MREPNSVRVPNRESARRLLNGLIQTITPLTFFFQVVNIIRVDWKQWESRIVDDAEGPDTSMTMKGVTRRAFAPEIGL